MKFKNSRLWVQHTPLVVARDSFLILLAAFLVRYGLHDLIEPYAAFHFFMVACVIVAIRYGYQAAFTCLIASYFLGNYFFVKPYGQFGEITTSDLIQAFNFFFVASISILVIEKLQRVVYSQKLLIKVMHDRQRSLLYRKNELVNKLRELERER
jgi:K+-sensing histidine kinase KdpD